MTKKSAVVDRLSSGLEQLVNVVSSQLPADRYDLQHGGGPMQLKNRDHERHSRVRHSVKSYSSISVPDSGSALSDTDLMEEAMSLERATFPPGKRRKSCMVDMAVSPSAAVTQPESGRPEPEVRKKTKSGDGGTPLRENIARRMVKSLGYSSSFDLGMTQPGSLALWRSNSERGRSTARRCETADRKLVASDVSGCWSTDDCSKMATFAGRNVQLMSRSLTEVESRRQTTDVVDDVFSKAEERVDKSAISHQHQHHHQQQQQKQQQQEDGKSLQQSRHKSDMLTLATWSKSNRRARRRWSELVSVPDTPPCSPSSPDWYNPRFTPELFTSRDLRRRFMARDAADSPQSESRDVDDENEPQVRWLTTDHSVHQLTYK